MFGPHHLKYQGNVSAIINLDSSTAHDIKQFLFPTLIGIKLLSPKVTSSHPPADMGIMTYIKVGYKAFYLWNLLEVFDTPVGFKRAAVSRKRQRREFRGI